MTQKIKVGIVEDFMRFRKGLIMAFKPYENEIAVIFEAGHGEEMIRALDPSNMPDVVLLDLQMPVMDGIQTTSWLNANHPRVKIIILTTHTDERFITHMLAIGAHGYLFKNEEPSLIKAAIVEVFNKGYSMNFIIEGILKKSQSKPGAQPPE